MEQVKKLKKELAVAAVSAMVAAVSLTSATYAWYVANNTVTATTSTISATTNGFILQIAKLSEGAQHGGEQKSLEAFSTGATLSPASSDDMKNWYICQSWDNQGLVTDYSVPSFETGIDAKPGNYKVSGNDYYAFIRSDYIVYTITETGTADVYLPKTPEVNTAYYPKKKGENGDKYPILTIWTTFAPRARECCSPKGLLLIPALAREGRAACAPRHQRGYSLSEENTPFESPRERRGESPSTPNIGSLQFE